MPYATFTPPVAPSPGTTITPLVALNETTFGDGYAQASPRGINALRRKVSLSWDALTFEQAKAIEGFFIAQAGYKPFMWTVRGDSAPTKWVCRTWSRTDAAPAGVRATFDEWFGNAG
ncbi:phage tail protein [Paracoccus sanguinis]|uniref:phage tail protein n=1 Tax=Paracoccus sanguinis TaxID=1545044 RepID=UPI00051F9FF0|nr:phage tail protein [Paracoccus sanguinis]KGJ13593.1 hypothetical protein IX54_11050 [Paracoccus sanguinis]